MFCLMLSSHLYLGLPCDPLVRGNCSPQTLCINSVHLILKIFLVRRTPTIRPKEKPEPESKKRSVTVLQWTEGLLGTLNIRGSDQQRIMRKELRGDSERQEIFVSKTSVLDFFKTSSGTRASSHVLLNIGADAADGLPAVEQEVSPAVQQEGSPAVQQEG
jgi:hypothetical protein